MKVGDRVRITSQNITDSSGKPVMMHGHVCGTPGEGSSIYMVDVGVSGASSYLFIMRNRLELVSNVVSSFKVGDRVIHKVSGIVGTIVDNSKKIGDDCGSMPLVKHEDSYGYSMPLLGNLTICSSAPYVVPTASVPTCQKCKTEYPYSDHSGPFTCTSCKFWM